MLWRSRKSEKAATKHHRDNAMAFHKVRKGCSQPSPRAQLPRCNLGTGCAGPLMVAVMTGFNDSVSYPELVVQPDAEAAAWLQELRNLIRLRDCLIKRRYGQVPARSR